MPNLGEQFSEEGYRTPNLGDASLGTVAEASFEVGMRDLAFTSMYQWWNRRDVSEVAPDNVMSRTESEDMISSHGLNPHDFKLDDDNIRGDVQSNIWLNQRMSMLNNLTSQASSQRWSATATSLGSGMGAELLDPVNYIASFLAPVKMAGAGTKLGHRFLARAKQSVGESLAVGVMGQPFIAEARLRRGEEYDASTFVAEVGLDALIGTTIAGTLGGLSDIAHIATGRQLTGDPIIAEGQAIIDERSSLRYADKEQNDIMRQAVYFDYHNRTDSIDELMAPEYVKEKARTMARIDNAQHNGILTPEQANSATARVNGAASPISVRINPDGTANVDVTNPPVHNMDMEGMPLGIKTRVDNGMEVADAIKEYGEEVAGLEMRSVSDVRKILGDETPDSLSEWVSSEGGLATGSTSLLSRVGGMINHPSFASTGVSAKELRVAAQQRTGGADIGPKIFEAGEAAQASHQEMDVVLGKHVEIKNGKVTDVTDQPKPQPDALAVPPELEKRFLASRLQADTKADRLRTIDEYFDELPLEKAARLTGEPEPLSLAKWFHQQDVSGKDAFRRVKNSAVTQGYFSAERMKGMGDDAFLRLVDADDLVPSIYRQADAKRITKAKNTLRDKFKQAENVTVESMTVQEAMQSQPPSVQRDVLSAAKGELEKIQKGRSKGEVDARTNGRSLDELRVEAKKRGFISPTATDKDFVKALLSDITKGNVYSKKDIASFGDWVNASLKTVDDMDVRERAKISDMENTMNADLSAYIKDMNDRMTGTKYSALLDPEHMDIIEKSKDLPDLETELGKQPEMEESIKRDFGEDSDIVADMEAELNKAARTQKDFLKAAEEIMACQLGIAPK